MKEVYERYSEVSFCGDEQHRPKFRQFAYNYKRFFPVGTAARVLDVGIGRGEMLSCMRDWGYDYIGIDISLSTVEYCRNLGLRCERVDDSLAWLLAHPAEFVVITLLDVLEHLPPEQLLPFLRALRHALSPSGVLLIQTPNMQAFESYLHRYNDITHVSGFTEHSLRQLLLAGGFEAGGVSFHGFEILVKSSALHLGARGIRRLFWWFLTLVRALTANLRPQILHPVFFAVARKKQD